MGSNSYGNKYCKRNLTSTKSGKGVTALYLGRKQNRGSFRNCEKFVLPDASNLCQKRFFVISGVMVIHLLLGRQIGADWFCAMGNAEPPCALGLRWISTGGVARYFLPLSSA